MNNLLLLVPLICLIPPLFPLIPTILSKICEGHCQNEAVVAKVLLSRRRRLFLSSLEPPSITSLISFSMDATFPQQNFLLFLHFDDHQYPISSPPTEPFLGQGQLKNLNHPLILSLKSLGVTSTSSQCVTNHCNASSSTYA